MSSNYHHQERGSFQRNESSFGGGRENDGYGRPRQGGNGGFESEGHGHRSSRDDNSRDHRTTGHGGFESNRTQHSSSGYKGYDGNASRHDDRTTHDDRRGAGSQYKQDRHQQQDGGFGHRDSGRSSGHYGGYPNENSRGGSYRRDADYSPRDRQDDRQRSQIHEDRVNRPYQNDQHSTNRSFGNESRSQFGGNDARSSNRYGNDRDENSRGFENNGGRSDRGYERDGNSRSFQSHGSFGNDRSDRGQQRDGNSRSFQNHGGFSNDRNERGFGGDRNSRGFQNNGFDQDRSDRRGFDRDGGNHSFQRNHNGGDRGYDRHDRGNQENRSAFRNDGGFNDRGPQGGNYAAEAPRTGERAPRDWKPEEADVDDLMTETASKVEQCNVAEDQEVEIRNSNIETRLTSWENSGLEPQILENLRRLKYNNVRTIQAAMIPQIMAGHDVIGQAETSAGKTAAFGLPIVNYIMKLDQETRSNSNYSTAPLALILAPTRELANQIFDSLRTFCRGTDIIVRLSYGEIDKRQNLKEIRDGCDILVGTCGRIMDMITKREISMGMLKFFVLDEADRLLQDVKQDPRGHLAAILDDVEFKESSATRQTLMTSATFDGAVETLAGTIMRPIEGRSDLVRIVLSRGRLNERVKLEFSECRGLMKKHERLREILLERNEKNEIPKTLIFVQKKDQCDHLAAKLSNQGFDAQTLHGGRSQDTRDRLIHQFKRSDLNILVTTDVLARGIDVTDLERVINFDLPQGSVESAGDTFVHRCGRTGRMHDGTAYSFVDLGTDNDSRLTPCIADIINAQKRENNIPEWLSQAANDNRGRGGDFANNRSGGFSSRSGGFNNGRGGFFAQSNNSGGGFGKTESFGQTSTVGGGFESAKTSGDAEERRGFGFAAKQASEQEKLGSSSFGTTSEDKKETPQTENAEDDDW